MVYRKHLSEQNLSGPKGENYEAKYLQPDASRRQHILGLWKLLFDKTYWRQKPRRTNLSADKKILPAKATGRPNPTL